MTCSAVRRAGSGRGSSGCAYGPRIYEQANNVINLPSRLSKVELVLVPYAIGRSRNGKGTRPQGGRVQPRRCVTPVVHVGRHTPLHSRIEVVGKTPRMDSETRAW